MSPDLWRVMREQAAMLVKTRFLPRGVDTPEKAIAIMLKGRELGIPPMYALSNIAVINGKPTAGAELMLALIYRDHGDDAIHIVESTAVRCTVAYKRRTWSEHETYSFTIEDADRADLLTKDNWQHYPAAMLRARCISAVARLAFPDCIGGLYTPEELGAAVRVQPDEDLRVAVIQEESAPWQVDEPAPASVLSPRHGRPATEQQLMALAKLSRLLDAPIPGDDQLDTETAADLIVRLSRRYNELEPAERSRRARELSSLGSRSGRSSPSRR
jgi:hypothetical protein